MQLRESRIAAAVALVCGLALLGFGAFKLWRRGERPFLVLRPEALVVPGLDRPIAWDEVADLDMTRRDNRMTTRLLLPPDAPFPEGVGGASRLMRRRSRSAGAGGEEQDGEG